MKKFIHNLKISVLAFLVHHANRLGSDSQFYRIKSELLLKFGQRDGYDLQEFSGRECFTCDGSGQVLPWYDGDDTECSRCNGTGYWRLPCYIVLDKFKLGKYSFHTPQNKVYSTSVPGELREGAKKTFHTYIAHTPDKRFAKASKLILFLIYNREVFWQRFLPNWLLYPAYMPHDLWKPKYMLLNLIHVLVHAFKTKGKNIPLFDALRALRNSNKTYDRLASSVQQSNSSDDLPF